MVFFNYATMQMAAKIVYYGPGLCGKTTNLHHIYAKTSPQSRGEMVSLETETDRTLFFDLLPIDVGVIGGFKTRLQLYTVPGQVFYNTTRKLVLKGVDGIVFVADSQRPMLDANVESLKNLRENLAEIGTNLDEIPLVLQLNKRDLPNIASVDMMLDALDPQRHAEHVESIASAGTGVFETLKTISKLTLRTLRRRMTGEEPSRASATRSGQFRVQDNSRTMAGGAAVPPPHHAPTPAVAQPPGVTPPATPSFATPAAPQPAATAAPRVVTEPMPAMKTSPVETPTLVEERPYDPLPAELDFDPEATVAASFDRRLLADAPVAEPPESVFAPIVEAAPVVEAPQTLHAPHVEEPPADVFPEPPAEAQADIPVENHAPPPVEATPEPTAASFDAPLPPPPPQFDFAPLAEPEIDFSEAEKPQKSSPEVKTVKVRSSVDVMAELEALRKRATNTTTKAPKRDVIADLDSLRPKRDLNRTLHLQLPPGVLSRTKSVRVTLSFEDGQAAVIDTQNQNVELGDASDVQSLSVNLKIDLA
jgi:signal recognition particle receptor subunit beta